MHVRLVEYTIGGPVKPDAWSWNAEYFSRRLAKPVDHSGDGSGRSTDRL